MTENGLARWRSTNYFGQYRCQRRRDESGHKGLSESCCSWYRSDRFADATQGLNCAPSRRPHISANFAVLGSSRLSEQILAISQVLVKNGGQLGVNSLSAKVIATTRTR